ncbi:type II toxin-antitoxin system VapC family toxin [Myxococcota bacterium]|nr:type II toxin-antitoxin system VapC family toxin [Myxococcota bacterium]
MLLVVDANVLIDYANAERGVLALAARHLGPLMVARDVLDEVDQLDQMGCEELGIGVVEPTAEQLAEAGAGKERGLSFPDRVCLIVARDRGCTCVSNDGALLRACASAGVPTMRGLALMIELVWAGRMAAAQAISVATRISAGNPWVSAAVVAEFVRKVGR